MLSGTSQSPAVGSHIEFQYDEHGKAIGYFDADQRFIPLAAPSQNLEAAPRSGTIISLVGDYDNFGYGGAGAPPCEYYDLSGANDVGVFDRELTGGDETDTWVHNFTGDAGYGAGFVATDVLVELREYFSDLCWSNSCRDRLSEN